jgi:hypothetical protein
MVREGALRLLTMRNFAGLVGAHARKAKGKARRRYFISVSRAA